MADDRNPADAYSDRIRESLDAAAKDFDRAAQALQEADWDDKSETNIYITQTGKADTPPESEKVANPPAPIKMILAWFPPKFRPWVLVGILFVLLQIPAVRQMLGFELPASPRRQSAELPPEPDQLDADN